MANSSTDEESSLFRSLVASGRIVLFGQNSRLSAWIWFIAVVSTVAVTVTVAVTAVRYTSTGPTAGETVAVQSASYTQLIDQLILTFRGTRYYLLFLVGPIALFLGAIGSAYLNSGLLPTGGLVLGPIFGFFVNRVGTPTIPGLVSTPLPLTDAVIFALTGAFLYGIPIAVLGFVIGTVLRQTINSKQWVSKQFGNDT